MEGQLFTLDEARSALPLVKRIAADIQATVRDLSRINGAIGVEMIQHGGEMQYADFSEQSIDVFGPCGEQTTILNEYSVRGWYETVFRGRRPIGPTRA